MQIKYLNRSLQRFDATQVIPTQFVMFTLSVILGSAILYRDFERTNGRGAGEFVGGCALTFLGVWVITTGRPHDDNDEEEEEEERAPEQEDAIYLGPEEYGDDEVHFGPSSDSSRRHSALMNEFPTMSALTPYTSAGSHHRRPSMHRLNTPHITFTSEPPSQAVTVTTTPAGLDMDDDSLTANPWATDSLISSLNHRSNQPPLLHTTNSSPILPSEAEALTSQQHGSHRPDTPRRGTSPATNQPNPPPPSSRPSTPPGPGGSGTLRRKSHTTPSPSSSRPQPTPTPRPSDTEPATPSSSTNRARGTITTPSTSITSTPHNHHLKRGSISLLPGPLTSPLSSSLSAVVADSLRKGVELRSHAGSAPGTPTSRPRRNTREGGGAFGGWLGGGGAGVAGPRDAGADAGRRRSRGVSVSGEARSRGGSFAAEGGGVVREEEEGQEQAEGSERVKSGGEVAEGSEQQQQQQPQREGEGNAGASSS